MTPNTCIILVLLHALQGVSAFWRMECRGRTAVARMDPLMSLGTVSQHAHSIHGSSGFSESATFDTLVAGNCTSCAAEQDMSAYWTPNLYYASPDGTFEMVDQIGGMLSYYLLRDPKSNVKAFPKGFRMIAGDALRRNYTLGDPAKPDPEQSSWAGLGQTSQADLAQRALGFNCLNYQKTPEAALYRHFMPDKAYLDANCPQGLRLELAFPSCWNGKDIDSDDHQSHMAYPDLVQDGNCPPGFQTRLITLFYETIWNTAKYQNRPGGYFTLSNGDPTGFGYHGDFMTGWDPDFLQSAVDQCTNMSGELIDCPLFNLQDEATQGECQIEQLPVALKAENVFGGTKNALKTLPGNVQVQYGPQPANMGGGFGLPAPAKSSTFAAPTLTYQPGTSSYGGVFIETSATSSAAVVAPTPATSATSAAGGPSIEAVLEPSVNLEPSAAPPATTPAPTSVRDPNISYEVVSTEYRTNGALVQEIVWEEAVRYLTEDVVTTVTVSPTPLAQEKRHIRGEHLLRHRHHAGRR